MDFHPVADIFPMMSAVEFGALIDDITENGLREPIWLHDNQIIDGRNRYNACKAIDIEPKYREWNGQGSLVAFVVSLNLKRRHLTSSQLAVVALDIEKHLAEEAKARQIATLKRGASLPDPQIFADREVGEAREQAAAIVGTNRQYVSDAKKIEKEAPDLLPKVRDGKITIPEAKREVNARQRAEVKARPVELPVGKYSCIVIDPPWPMEKIERDERPNQVGFDYPTMTEEELQAFALPEFAADDCHLYLWATHKFLPMALRLAEHWGFRYQCLMTWVKNVGFTPFSWMYSTEHVLFCRRGSLRLEKLGMRLDFAAKVREHSRKPDEFYDLVRQASPGPRIDVFSREVRDGFDQWGKESGKFAEVAA
jgi:N6-adenosine-specific RNA methylase IME4